MVQLRQRAAVNYAEEGGPVKGKPRCGGGRTRASGAANRAITWFRAGSAPPHCRSPEDEQEQEGEAWAGSSDDENGSPQRQQVGGGLTARRP